MADPLATTEAAPSNEPRAHVARAPARIGWSIDHFTIGRELGSGGMGTVYQARDNSLDRLVALKVLKDDMAAKIDARERFVREARAQARLNSPHVVHIYFVGYVSAPPDQDDDDDAAACERSENRGPGALYFAMEFVDGESLEAGLDRGETLDPERARTLMIGVCRGLRDAHRAGVVHRDIKPGNLLVDRAGTVKVADFGLAKPDDPKQSLTRGGVVLGTPHYMPPEQGLGGGLDFRADMYSLGCTFYHALSGTTPFDGPNGVALIAHHMNTRPQPIRQRAAHVPPALAAIIDRLLEKKRDDRYGSYDDLMAALEAAAPEHVEYAGFWTRAAALAIDAVLGSILIGLLHAAGLLVYLAYVSVALAITGQTFGKYVLRVRVVAVDGKKLGGRRAVARTAVMLWLPILVAVVMLASSGVGELKDSVSALAGFEAAKRLVVPLVVGNAMLSLLYAAGFVVAAFRKDKRALHDLVAGSSVRYIFAARSPAKTIGLTSI